MTRTKEIFKSDAKGIYVIVDPQQDATKILERLGLALTQEIAAIQIWDNQAAQHIELLTTIIQLAKQHAVPVLINNDVALLSKLDFDGIHFDAIPAQWETIQEQVKSKIVGITCTNDLAIIEWAATQQVDYISFCSLFDSKNNSSCELVDYRSISRAREMTTIPFVLAGGITLENIELLGPLEYQAVAMISGVMDEPHPEDKIKAIYKRINHG